MEVSVIIPTYNRSDVILKSLHTWLNQNYSVNDFEIIVVDNNSSDTTGKLISELLQSHSNLKYEIETKKGSTYARHKGVELAKSEILIFADDDGLYNENCIEEILNVYKLNSEVEAVAGKIDILWDKNPPEWIAPFEFMLGKLNYGNEIIYDKSLFINGGLFSIKKSTFLKLGGFNPDLVGEYLVGDGDTGLVIKLHQNNCLIGWTPFAEMKHMQFVDKQGTVEDMGRRFFNVGISNAFGRFNLNNFKFNFQIIKYIFKTLIFWIKKSIEYKLKNDRKTFFSLMQRSGELKFFQNWIFKTDIRNELLKSKL